MNKDQKAALAAVSFIVMSWTATGFGIYKLFKSQKKVDLQTQERVNAINRAAGRVQERIRNGQFDTSRGIQGAMEELEFEIITDEFYK